MKSKTAGMTADSIVQTTTVEPPGNRFLIVGAIILIVVILGTFSLFPSTARQNETAQSATGTNRSQAGDLVSSLNAAGLVLDINDGGQFVAETVVSPDTKQTLALIQRVYDEVLSQGNLAVAKELFAQPFHYYELGWPDNVRGFERVKMLALHHRGAFPDLHYKIKKIVVDEDLVVVRWMAKTSKGEVIPGNQMAWAGTTVWRINQGKIVEAWTTLTWSSWPGSYLRQADLGQ